MFIKKDDMPVYLMIFLIFFGFCNFVKLPFDKDILIAVLNGLFILIAAIYGTNTLARKNLMKKYSDAYVKQDFDLQDELEYVKGEVYHWGKNPPKNEEEEDARLDKSIELANEYNKMLREYKALLTEIYLYSGNEIPCEFDWITNIDPFSAKVLFSKEARSSEYKPYEPIFGFAPKK